MGELDRVLWVVESYDESAKCWLPQAMWAHWSRSAARREQKKVSSFLRTRIVKYVPAAGRGD